MVDSRFPSFPKCFNGKLVLENFHIAVHPWRGGRDRAGARAWFIPESGVFSRQVRLCVLLPITSQKHSFPGPQTFVYLFGGNRNHELGHILLGPILGNVIFNNRGLSLPHCRRWPEQNQTVGHLLYTACCPWAPPPTDQRPHTSTRLFLLLKVCTYICSFE